MWGKATLGMEFRYLLQLNVKKSGEGQCIGQLG